MLGGEISNFLKGLREFLLSVGKEFNMLKGTKSYEVKNVKSLIGSEGSGFTADLYKNGKKIAFVTDSADGGPYQYDFSTAQEKVLIEKVVNNLPAKEYYGTIIQPNLEIFIGSLLDAFEYKKAEMKMFKKASKTTTLFKLKNEEENSWRSVKSPCTSGVLEYLQKKYGDKLKSVVVDCKEMVL